MVLSQMYLKSHPERVPLPLCNVHLFNTKSAKYSEPFMAYHTIAYRTIAYTGVCKISLARWSYVYW